MIQFLVIRMHYCLPKHLLVASCFSAYLNDRNERESLMSRLLLSALLMGALTACGGGGSAGNSNDLNVVIDTIAPTIVLNGERSITLDQGANYTEQGAIASDDTDQEVTITTSGSVDTGTVASYSITYTATDAAGNTSSITRIVNIVLAPDTTPPVITLNGDSSVTTMQGYDYIELGASATDDRDGNVDVMINQGVNILVLGTYTATYTATDSAGNTSSTTRTVNVVLAPDTTAPVVTLNGESSITVVQTLSYEELGASATDDGDESVTVVINGSVDTNTIDTYTLTYTATDSAGNEGTATRTVNVVADTTPPAITLNGLDSIILIENGTYSEQGASALDNVDGDVNVVITGDIDPSDISNQLITYTATDAAGNSSELTRTISVQIETAFITTWKTDNTNTNASDSTQVKISTFGSGYDYQVNWGDGTSNRSVNGDKTHTYAEAGTYTITITGNFPQLYFSHQNDGDGYDNSKIISVEQWGNRQWRSMYRAFYECANVVVNATDTPDLSQLTDMESMFQGATQFNSDINNWNVSSVTNMKDVFVGTTTFNQPLDQWDVSSVTRMTSMLSEGVFNQDIKYR